MARVRQSIQEGTVSDFSKVPFGCVGVDLNIEAIRDARQNALENGFTEKRFFYKLKINCCTFICSARFSGKYLNIFKYLITKLSSNNKLLEGI